MNKNIELGLGKIQSVFVNPYTACTNSCTYCALGETQSLSNKINLPVLKHHSFHFIEFIKQIQNELEENCQFIFLGGEPLLAWKSWLIPTIDSLHRINSNFKFRFSTNGVLLTEDKYEDIEKYQIDVNFSLDGPKHVHNLNRKLLSKVGSFDIAYDNFLNIPHNLSHLLHPCATIHLNTVQYLPEIFQFIKDTYEIRPFNWFTMNQTDGFNWTEKELKLFENGMKQIKEMMPVKFNVNFIPNPPRNQNLIVNFNSGLIVVKSNELSNPIPSIIGNITKEDGYIFEDKLIDYQKYHHEKRGKRILPNQDLCNICPGKDIYCVRKEKEFFNDMTYINLKNFCNHNYILYTIFGGNYYESRTIS